MPELVDLVDKHGEVQKLAVPRHEVDQHDGLHMQIVIIVIFDSLGRMLVHRRGKEPHIGHIDHICGGLASGESPLDAATREALEEVGVTPRNLRVVDTRVNESDKLVFITHGLTGSKDQPHIIGMREAFVDEGFTVVSFDTAHSFGESEGDSINATATSYVEDLEDVITWAQGQQWYKEPFALAGHSLGGLSSLVYGSNHPDKVSALFPMSTVVSGKLWQEVHDKEFLKNWEKKGYFFRESQSRPGKSGRIGWGLTEDLLKYDALEFAHGITCPVLLVVGSDDDVTTPEMHQLLHEQLGGKKELHIIKGMKHDPANQKQIDEMKDILKEWVSKL